MGSHTQVQQQTSGKGKLEVVLMLLTELNHVPMNKQWKLPFLHGLGAPHRSEERKGLLETLAIIIVEPSLKDSSLVLVSPKMAAAWCCA